MRQGEFRGERKHLFWHHINESQREWVRFCQKYSESVRNLGLHCFLGRLGVIRRKYTHVFVLNVKNCIFWLNLWYPNTSCIAILSKSALKHHALKSHLNAKQKPFYSSLCLTLESYFYLDIKSVKFAAADSPIRSVSHFRNKKVEIFEEIVSTTVDLKKFFFLLENKINKTIHFSQNQRENDTRQNVTAKRVIRQWRRSVELISTCI